VNRLWRFFHADQHDFAFTASATNKTNGGVIFEWMKISDDIHVHVHWIAVRAG